MLPEISFGFSLGMIFYTYLGYPLLIFILSTLRSKSPEQKTAEYPNLSLIITARNEARHIQEKIENSLQLDYPRDKLEIIVVSDASDDATDEIVSHYAKRGVRLIRHTPRQGKTAAQNAAVKVASGEILVFSDATTHYRPEALLRLQESFSQDPRIGCACGHLSYGKDALDRYEEVHYYWGWEVALRKRESQLGFIPGVSGCIYAVRREAFTFLQPDDISDFLQPLMVAEKGLNVVYQPLAMAVERRSPDLLLDFHRRRRTIARGLHGMTRYPRFLNPLHFGLRSIQILSHKVLRWFSVFFLMLAYLCLLTFSSIALSCGVTLLLVLTLLLGILGIIFRCTYLGRFLKLPAYLLLAGTASLLGLWDWMRGHHHAVWEPQR